MCTKLLLISVVPDLTPKVQTTNNEAITPMIHLTFQQKKKEHPVPRAATLTVLNY